MGESGLLYTRPVDHPPAKNERRDEQDDENEQQNLRDVGEIRGHATKAKDSSDQRKNCKQNGPANHDETP